MDQISNFEFLKHHDELLFRLAKTAEQSFVPDPNTTLMKVRQLGEALAQNVAARVGVEYGRYVKQVDLLRELEYTLILDQKIKDAFHYIRKLGNDKAEKQYLAEQLLPKIKAAMLTKKSTKARRKK